jgi:hypothetical protein
VPDVTLVEKLCETLDAILGDTPIEGPTNDLLPLFGRHLEFKTFFGVETRRVLWAKNEDESKVRNLDPHSRMRALADSWDRLGGCWMTVFSTLRRSVWNISVQAIQLKS